MSGWERRFGGRMRVKAGPVLARVLIVLALGCAVGQAGTAIAEEPSAPSWGAIEVLGVSVAPGERGVTRFESKESFLGNLLDPAVVVMRGVSAGPTLCVTGGIHGDEVNGVETAHRLYAETDPATLRGTLIVMPALNVAGFRSGSRYLPDRRDLNRAFPGNPNGSVASRIAYAVFENVIRHCDALVDLHTASFHRTNVPQIRTDLKDEGSLALAKSFGVGVVLNGRGPKGSLRRAALDAGIPAVIYEAGQPMRLEEKEIALGVRGVRNVMAHQGLIDGSAKGAPDAEVYRKTTWVRAGDIAGVFLTSREPGERVAAGDVLGTVTDPVTEERQTIVAPGAGTIIGMAIPQVVLPGYGLFHLGTKN